MTTNNTSPASQPFASANADPKNPEAGQNTNEHLYTIKQAATKLKTTPGAIRYYYRVGLIPNVKRAKNGYRLLDANQLTQIRTLVFLKRCGLNNREVRRYINLERQGSSTIPARQALLETKKRQIWQQIKDCQENIDFIERQEELFTQAPTNLKLKP
jgi:DNA-binding transcriptional MerR regulator